MRVAIVHEWLVNFRGSERVLLELSRMFPEATIYASVLDRSQLPDELARRDIRTTFIQQLPLAKKKYQWYLPLMPMAYESLDLRDYDLIISSSHSCAKGVIPPPHAVHICYCYTPMRYAWSGYHEYRESLKNPIARMMMGYLMHRLRKWDVSSVSRVDHFVAISTEIQERIQKYYRRSSAVIHPPVAAAATEGSQTNPKLDKLLATLAGEPFFLSLGRLVSYKRVDIAVDACTAQGMNLVVAGGGPELDALRRRAGPTVHFLTEFSDLDAAKLYQACLAFLFPGQEDFGITIVEAQSYGKPVIAYGNGGALDSVIDGVTGILFSEQTPESLMSAIKQFHSENYREQDMRENASRFSVPVFHASIDQFLSNHNKLLGASI